MVAGTVTSAAVPGARAWDVVVGDRFIAAVAAPAPDPCLAALATAAADGDVTIESLVGLVPLGGSHPVDSFAFVWWPGRRHVRGHGRRARRRSRRPDLSRGHAALRLPGHPAVAPRRVRRRRRHPGHGGGGPARPARRGDRPGAPRPGEPPGLGGGVGDGGGAASAGCLGRGCRHHPDAARPAGGGDADDGADPDPRRRPRRALAAPARHRAGRRSADGHRARRPRRDRRGGVAGEPARRSGCSAATRVVRVLRDTGDGAGAADRTRRARVARIARRVGDAGARLPHRRRAGASGDRPGAHRPAAARPAHSRRPRRIAGARRGAVAARRSCRARTSSCGSRVPASWRPTSGRPTGRSCAARPVRVACAPANRSSSAPGTSLDLGDDTIIEILPAPATPLE